MLGPEMPFYGVAFRDSRAVHLGPKHDAGDAGR
jgi:hypothetical protein